MISTCVGGDYGALCVKENARITRKSCAIKSVSIRGSPAKFNVKVCVGTSSIFNSKISILFVHEGKKIKGKQNYECSRHFSCTVASRGCLDAAAERTHYLGPCQPGCQQISQMSFLIKASAEENSELRGDSVCCMTDSKAGHCSTWQPFTSNGKQRHMRHKGLPHISCFILMMLACAVCHPFC